MESPAQPMKLIATTDDKIVGLIQFQGQVIVATERGVWRLEGDKFVQLKFVVEHD